LLVTFHKLQPLTCDQMLHFVELNKITDHLSLLENMI
jgi:hypothetical protein